MAALCCKPCEYLGKCIDKVGPAQACRFVNLFFCARVGLSPRAARRGASAGASTSARRATHCAQRSLILFWRAPCVSREHSVNRALGSCLLLTLRRQVDGPPSPLPPRARAPRAPAHSALARSHANFSASFSARWIGRPPSSSPTLSLCAAFRLLSPSAVWRRAQSVRHP